MNMGRETRFRGTTHVSNDVAHSKDESLHLRPYDNGQATPATPTDIRVRVATTGGSSHHASDWALTIPSSLYGRTRCYSSLQRRCYN
jgi:hypothetical protein